jgi:hypothetical protein
LKNLFHISIIIFLTFNACNRPEKEEKADNGLKMRISADSSAVELYHIPQQVTDQFKSDSLKTEHWQNFFAVYEEPEDPEMRDFQPPLEGSYQLSDTLVNFVPAAGFKRGLAYFSRCYTRELLEEPEDIISKRELSSTDGFLEYKFNIR